MIIYAVRHGETNWNRQSRIQGRSDIQLNENGIKQAQNSAEALSSIPFCAAAVSPLIRTRQTAGIICEKCNIKDIHIEADIIERDFGAYEGDQTDNFNLSSFFEEQEGFEPIDSVVERMKRAADKMLEKHENETVLFVSHGAAIRIFLEYLAKKKLFDENSYLKNACINKISYQKESAEILLLNASAQEFIKNPQ